jgi:DNA-directed RNA polymerase subunit RPC12/RpoP
MAKKKSLAACPRCGDSTKGYTFTIRCVDRRVGSWDDGVSESWAIEGAQSMPKTVRCRACGVRVPNPEYKPR